jgi:glyoxylase-like metal-dependent hydrolase (beta-lactamase superfamily II)
VDAILEAGQHQIEGFDLEIIPAAGHAHNQVMIGWPKAGVCFAADAFFPPNVLDKHGIPFYVDVDQALETLSGLPQLPYRTFAPGHGDSYDDVTQVAGYNSHRLQAIRQKALQALDEPCDVARVLKRVADDLGVAIAQPAIYYLTRTTIHACLNSLRQAGLADLTLRENRLLWRAMD